MGQLLDPEGRRNDPDWEGHGTLTGYVKAQCRCPRCRAAGMEYARERTQRNLLRPVPEHVHGTAGGYANYGCRCEPCRAAKRAQRLQTIANKVAREHAELLGRLAETAQPVTS